MKLGLKSLMSRKIQGIFTNQCPEFKMKKDIGLFYYGEK